MIRAGRPHPCPIGWAAARWSEVVLPDGIAIGPDTFAGSRGLRKVWFLGLLNRLAEGAFARLDVVFYCRADSDCGPVRPGAADFIVALQP